MILTDYEFAYPKILEKNQKITIALLLLTKRSNETEEYDGRLYLKITNTDRIAIDIMSKIPYTQNKKSP